MNAAFKPTFLTALLLSATACTSDSTGAQLLVPDDVDLHWDDSFNGFDDGIGALVPVDLMVYDGQSGEPVGSVDLDVTIGGDGVSVVSQEQVQLAGDGYWDAYRDQYFLFDPPNAPASSAYLQTDADGLARLYLFVDAFPEGADSDSREADGSYAPVSVLVSSGLAEETFFLVPQ